MVDIDAVLTSIGVGRYQLTGTLLFGLILMFSNVSPYTYVFTAGDQKYRCEIPECDSPDSAERVYDPKWLEFAVPYRNDTKQFRKCERYVSLAGPAGNGVRCAPEGFTSNTTEPCAGSWVFENGENTIGTEFDLMCETNKLKLSMVGTINNVGQFIGIPISGILADYFGRKFTMIFSATVSAAIYIVQSFSVNYPMYLVLELMASIVSGGLYSTTFILAMELFLPKQRVLMYSILESFLPLGAIFVALISHWVKDWRYLLQITNIPALLFLSYFWLTAESMRWLELQGKHDQVFETLKKIAKTNKKPMPKISLDEQIQKSNDRDDSEKSMLRIIKNTLFSPIILWRATRCSFLWVVVTLVYYGTSINSTDIAGNKYLNFVLVSLVEIPACLLNWIIMEGLSRKTSLSSLFVVCSAFCVVYKFIPNEHDYAQKFVFMVIKLAISIAFNILYILTAEIFPTSMRATMVSVCSMIGRIGSALAPMTTLLNEYFGGEVTVLLFGLSTIMAAVVTTTLPESKNIKLPNTVDEAEQIGVDEKPQRDEISPS